MLTETAQSVFDTRYYEQLKDSCEKSARAVVPKLVQLINPKSVVDVGCGPGFWLAEFGSHGVEDLLGIDGEWIPEQLLKISSDRILKHDLVEPLELSKRFDLVVCLEVAEHFPASAADQLVETLTRLGPVILFSAAIPGQGGVHHINEQPPEWWERKFKARGFQRVKGFGEKFAGDQNVSWWYQRNMVFYVREGTLAGVDFNTWTWTKANGKLTKKKGVKAAPARSIKLDKILPVMLSCARNKVFVEQMLQSFDEQVGEALPSPTLVVDLTGSQRLPGDYFALLSKLSPASVHIHPRAQGLSDKESINDAAFFALECGLTEMKDQEFLLFLEDDILFSSQFIPYLKDLKVEGDAGFVTLYLPGNDYGTSVIEPYKFYGTQAVLFPKEVIQVILDNRKEMEAKYSPNYDLRWAQYLGSCGYKLYAAPQSYVQHTGTSSRLGSGYHSSCSFVE